MFRRLLTGVALLATSQLLLASKPYQDYEFEFKQPNGDIVTIILNGDDYYAEQRSRTGKLVIYDETLNGMVYADINEAHTLLTSTGELVSSAEESRIDTNTNRYIRRRGLSSDSKKEESDDNQDEKGSDETKAQSIGIQPVFSASEVIQNRAAYISGDVKGLTIIIQFPDETASISRNQVDSFLNDLTDSEFGNQSSVRGYFQNVSNNALNYTNTVSQYYTAQHNKAYYTDSNLSTTVRTRELIGEALQWLEHTQGFDFSTLSTDENNRIMGLNVLYAGEADSAWSRGLWPHLGALKTKFCADGVCTDRYQTSSMGQGLSLGDFVHETGHLLARWPDLFDYDASSYGSVARFGLMGFGSSGVENTSNPVAPNGYFRYLSGWDTAIELNPEVNPNAPQGNLELDSGDHTLYRWSNPHHQGEAFYIENIQQEGTNQAQPDAGLAVWHIDPDGDNSDESLPFLQLEHADGNRDPESLNNLGDDTDLFESSDFGFNSPNYLDNLSTNSRWSNGNDSGLAINQISQPGNIMSFVIGSVSQEPQTTTTSYYGYLNNQQTLVAPNEGWFFYNGGTISVELEGLSNNADFDLALQKWNGSNWILVSIAQSPTQTESISYTGTAGYYRVLAYSYYGNGYFTLDITK